MYTTGDKLLNVMKEEEIGIAELSRISSVPERTILDIMAGVKEPELGVMCKIAEGLGIYSKIEPHKRFTKLQYKVSINDNSAPELYMKVLYK